MLKIFFEIPLLIFDVSGGEFLLVVFAILMLFGPKKIPEIARTFGKGMAELRRATEDVKREIMTADLEKGVDDVNSSFEKIKNDIKESTILKDVHGTVDNLKNDMQSTTSPNVVQYPTNPPKTETANPPVNIEPEKGRDNLLG